MGEAAVRGRWVARVEVVGDPEAALAAQQAGAGPGVDRLERAVAKLGDRGVDVTLDAGKPLLAPLPPGELAQSVRNPVAVGDEAGGRQGACPLLLRGDREARARERVEVVVEVRAQTQAVAFHEPRRFVAAPVLRKPELRVAGARADVDPRNPRIAAGAGSRRKLDDVDAVLTAGGH